MSEEPRPSPSAGLCESCQHVRRVTSSRGAVFYQCQLSFTDSRFPRYPPLPVLRCAGYARACNTPPGDDTS